MLTGRLSPLPSTVGLTRGRGFGRGLLAGCSDSIRSSTVDGSFRFSDNRGRSFFGEYKGFGVEVDAAGARDFFVGRLFICGVALRFDDRRSFFGEFDGVRRFCVIELTPAGGVVARAG